MGGGVAISGVIGKKKVMDLPEIGNMSSTNSANPLACQAGLAVLDEIKAKNLIFQAKKKGKFLFSQLNLIKNKFSKDILEVNGQGLIAAIIFNPKIKNISIKLKKVCEASMKKGLLLVYTGRESIKIGPPLTITKDAIREGLKILELSMEKVLNKND